MMGVYGMLAIGLALFCLRYLIPAERWPERGRRLSFWSLNIGLAWMCFATLFPLGILQLYESVEQRVLRGARARVPDQRHEHADRVAAPARRHPLHRRRRAPGALHRLARGPAHGQARDARGAGEHPLHRDRRARASRRGRRRGRCREDDGEPRRRCSSPATRRSCCGGRRCSSGSPPTRTGAPCAIARRASSTTRTSTPGSAPRASTCGHTRSTTSAASSATAPGPRLQRCPRKEACTDSVEGREVMRALDPWPHSEAGRGPFAQEGLDEAFGLAVGASACRAGSAGGGCGAGGRPASSVRDVARAVVGHHPLDADAPLGEPAQRARRKPVAALAALVGQHLDVGQADASSTETWTNSQPARAEAALRRLPVIRWPTPSKARQLLDVEVQQLARPRALVAVRRLDRLEPRALAQPIRFEHRRDGRERHPQDLGDLGRGHPQPRTARSPQRDRLACGWTSPRRRGAIPQAHLALARKRASHFAAVRSLDAGGLGRLRERPALLTTARPSAPPCRQVRALP